MLAFRLICAPLQVDGSSGRQQGVPAAGCTPVILQPCAGKPAVRASGTLHWFFVCLYEHVCGTQAATSCRGGADCRDRSAKRWRHACTHLKVCAPTLMASADIGGTLKMSCTSSDGAMAMVDPTGLRRQVHGQANTHTYTRSLLRFGLQRSQ